MIIALFKGRSFISRCIQFATRSPYSHAAFIFDDAAAKAAGRLNFDGGADLSKLKFANVNACQEAWQGGVQSSPSYRTLHRKGTKIDLLQFKDPLTPYEEEHLVKHIAADIGKPYSYRTIFRFFIMRLPPKDPGHLICSMYVYRECAKVGRELLDRTESWRVPPDFIWRSPLLRYKRTVVV